MACDCTETCGNDVHGIAVKVGEPLSAACQRFTGIGSIPEVIRMPWFTLANGALVTNYKASNGGIQNIENYFKTRSGCYYDTDARLAGCLNCPS